MRVALDTNILLALWKGEEGAEALAARLQPHSLLVCGPVVGELLPFTPDAEPLLTDMGLALDWSFPRAAWLRAGQAYAAYTARRRTSGSTLPRRVLTDHLIGAHAVTLGLPLVTLNGSDYSDFPELTVVVP